MRPSWSRVGPNDRRPWKERRGHRCVRVRRRRPREERAGDQRDTAVSQGTCWRPPDPGTDEKGFLPRQGASPADAGLGRPASGPTRECVSVSSRCVVMTALDGNTEGARSWGQGPRQDPTEAAGALGAAAQAPGDGSGARRRLRPLGSHAIQEANSASSGSRESSRPPPLAPRQAGPPPPRAPTEGEAACDQGSARPLRGHRAERARRVLAVDQRFLQPRVPSTGRHRALSPTSVPCARPLSSFPRDSSSDFSIPSLRPCERPE